MTIINYLKKLKNNFTPNSILDIGANVGNFSKACKNIWPETTIFMIEGNEYCEEDLKSTGYSYTIKLLGDIKKEVDFYIQRDNLKGTGASYYKEITTLYDDPIIIKKTLTTLDELVAEHTFDIIKIDTQGSELNIINGGSNTIAKATYVILELQIKQYNLQAPNMKDVIKKMATLGFINFEVIENHHWPNNDGLFEYNEIFQIDAVFTK
jgi:FkbM family methyltransferase